MKNNGEQGCGNDEPWKTRKTKNRFSVVSHSPWKAPKARFPHSHSPGDSREEKWKSKGRIPTFPSLILSFYKTQKGDSPKRRVPRRSGSSFDWNMLSINQIPAARK
jgi:hypothetical protein